MPQVALVGTDSTDEQGNEDDRLRCMQKQAAALHSSGPFIRHTGVPSGVLSKNSVHLSMYDCTSSASLGSSQTLSPKVNSLSPACQCSLSLEYWSFCTRIAMRFRWSAVGSSPEAMTMAKSDVTHQYYWQAFEHIHASGFPPWWQIRPILHPTTGDVDRVIEELRAVQSFHQILQILLHWVANCITAQQTATNESREWSMGGWVLNVGRRAGCTGKGGGTSPPSRVTSLWASRCLPDCKCQL